jgi:hypothetical protein
LRSSPFSVSAMKIVLQPEITTEVSDADADLASSVWYAVESGGIMYARAGGSSGPHLHRVIGERMTGEPLGKRVVDHMNGNSLDNRRENLRVVSHMENIRNRAGANKNGTSGHLGVSFHKGKGRWRAYIMLPGTERKQKMLHLGYFDIVEDAVKARLEAEREHWGVQPRRADAHSLPPALASTGVRC